MKTKITYVSPFIEKGRWLFNHYFYLKAAEASKTQSIDEYFVIHAQRIIPSENGRLAKIKTVHAAFCFHRFLSLATGDIENIKYVKNNEVHYKSIGNHPDAGDVEIDPVQDWHNYIRLRPEIIEFAINDKTSLLCYEEYQCYE